MPDDPYVETEAEAETIRQGEEAIQQIMQGFERWLTIGHALQAGRTIAMRVAGTSVPDGSAYKMAFNGWLERHPQFNTIAQSTRSWLYRCLENEADILEWRARQTNADRLHHNNPETVFKRWLASTQQD